MGAASHVVERVRAYFSTGIWWDRVSPRGGPRAALDRLSRILYSAARGFFDHQLTTRAAALTYYTVLSLVPFLAFAFAVLKGFGAYRTLIDGTLRPWLAGAFGENPALHDAIGRVLEFVDATDVSKLGTVGLLVLVYTSVSLVASVEAALNQIWGAKTARTFLRQVTDYVTLLVTTPILLLAATTLSAAAQSSWFVEFLRESMGLGPLIDLTLRLTPVLVVALALFAIYTILPNVRTRAASALLGAAVAAVLWHGALVLHVQSQMGVARYNALYSVLGAIPIFLVWTYVSWVVVLVGAELAASHQNEQMARQRFHARRADQALREILAVASAAVVAREFLDGAPRPTAASLAARLEVPLPLLEEVLESLVRAGILARAVCGRELGYVPGRDVDAARASDVRDALRRDPRADDVRTAVEARLGAQLARALRSVDDRGALHDLSLRALAQAVDVERGRSGDGNGAATAGRGGADVLDAKQPGAEG